jgi:hypothetical protein
MALAWTSIPLGPIQDKSLSFWESYAGYLAAQFGGQAGKGLVPSRPSVATAPAIENADSIKAVSRITLATPLFIILIAYPSTCKRTNVITYV